MKKVFYIPAILFVTALLLFGINLQARHIIGGTISYKVSPASQGNKLVEISLVLIRDCNPAAGGAYFDGPGHLAIYKGTNDQNVLFRTYEIQPSNITAGLANLPPWVSTPISICEETGQYIFSDSLPELQQGESYFIVYQRCCKSLSFVNILDPENSGLTLSIELTAAAMAAENDSPVFQNPASVLGCAHDSLVFNRPVVETDGDTYFYRLSPLVNGGGPILTDPGYTSCEGAIPTPPCGPGFGLVSYAGTEYSAAFPLGTTDPLLLNTTTGVLSCLPHYIGGFLVGLDVDEYRNGVLLSTVHSEFAVYLVDCSVDATVETGLENEVALAPNPSANTVFVTSKTTAWAGAAYTLKNLAGAAIQQGKLDGNNAAVNRGDLPAGVYWLELVANDGMRLTKKVVFQ